MRRSIFIVLFLCISISLCACKDKTETRESSVTPTASANTADTYGVEDTNVPSNKPSVVPSMQSEDTSDPENLVRPFEQNEFEQLSVNNSNFIPVDRNLSSKLAEKTRSYDYEKKQFNRENHKGKLEVEYPEFIGKDKNLQEVNAMIYSLVDQHVYVEEESDDIYDCYIDCEVKKATDSIISIVFTGYNYLRTTAHPENCEFTFNYDLKSKELIELNQVTTLDISFLEKSKGALGTQKELEFYKAILATNGDLNVLLDKLKDQNAVFYFEEDRIYVGFMINAVGFYTSYVFFEYR